MDVNPTAPSGSIGLQDSGGLDEPFPGTTQRWFFIPVLILAAFGVALAMGASVGAGFAKLVAGLDPSGKYFGVGLAASLSGVIATVVTPLSGRLSDRSRGRSGMRKPWLLWGSLVGFLGTTVISLTGNMVVVILAVLVAQVGYCLALMAQHALLAEQVPSRRLGVVNGWVGMGTVLALPAGTWFVALAPQTAWVWFVGPGAIGTLFSIALLPAFQDRVLRVAPSPLRIRDLLGSYWLSPRKAPSFAWAWAGRFLMFLAFAPLASFWLYYLTDRVGLQMDDAVNTLAQASLLLMAVVSLSGVLSGWLSDRIGRKPLVYFCVVSYLGTVVVLLLMPNTLGFWIGFAVLAGLGSGAFASVIVALQIELLPDFENAGKDLGIVTLSGSLPSVLGPLLGPVLLLIGDAPNYNAVIVFAIVATIAAGLCFIPIRQTR